MKERPILFSTPMVQAILEGRKTQTRRVINESFNGCFTNGGPHPCPNDPIVFHPGEELESVMEPGEKIVVDGDKVQAYFHCSTMDKTAYCPYGKIGDILWVREEHYRIGHWEAVPRVKTKGGRQKWKFVADSNEVRYFDNPPEIFRKGRHSKDPATSIWHKRLARFMPKSVCRLFLENTYISAERLNDISDDDAIAEGIIGYSDHILEEVFYKDYLSDASGFGHPDHDYPTVDNPVESYKSLWKKINGEESSNENPWVWVIEFKRIKRNG
jgi:hypothetical protein